MISALPERDAHSPDEFRKAMLMAGSWCRSSVLPDSVFVWKMRSRPPPSCRCHRQLAYLLGLGGLVLLCRDEGLVHVCWGGWGELTFAARAMHLLTSRPFWARVVIMPNLEESMNWTRSSTLSLSEAWLSRFFCLYGSAGLEPVSALLKVDMLVVDVGVKGL